MVWITSRLLISLQTIMTSHDLDNNGVISFDEFLHAMPLNATQITPVEHRLVRFENFDVII